MKTNIDAEKFYHTVSNLALIPEVIGPWKLEKRVMKNLEKTKEKEKYTLNYIKKERNKSFSIEITISDFTASPISNSKLPLEEKAVTENNHGTVTRSYAENTYAVYEEASPSSYKPSAVNWYLKNGIHISAKSFQMQPAQIKEVLRAFDVTGLESVT